MRIGQFENSQMNQIGKEFLNKLQEQLKSTLISLVFYGSRIRGDYLPESDLDILIILEYFDDSKMSRIISGICGDLTRKYFVKVSPYTISKEDFREGCKNLFPFNLGVYLSYHIFFGKEFIEENHNYISNAILSGKLRL